MLQNFLADSIETMKVVNAYSRMYRPQHFKSFMMTFGFYLGPPWILRDFFFFEEHHISYSLFPDLLYQ